MAAPHSLDRPIWNALNTGWAALAEGDAFALRLETGHGPFGASADASARSLDALAALIPNAGEMWLVEADPPAVPPGASVVRSGILTQMVADHIAPSARTVDLVELGEADAAEMRALAHLTKPGPFAALTHRLGNFVGVRRDGKLIAMAGERMRVDRFTEVSGVCTHPDHRGRGYAGALMRVVAQDILARGETPFLHSYADNDRAIGLYQSLGFRFRATINLAILSAAPD